MSLIQIRCLNRLTKKYMDSSSCRKQPHLYISGCNSLIVLFLQQISYYRKITIYQCIVDISDTHYVTLVSTMSQSGVTWVQDSLVKVEDFCRV